MTDPNGGESLGDKLQGLGETLGQKFNEVKENEGVQNAIQKTADAAKQATGGRFDEQIDGIVDKLGGDTPGPGAPGDGPTAA